MATTKEDRSFKTLINKRTTSGTKRAFEEFGDLTINTHLTEVWSEEVADNDPAQAVLDGVAEERTLFALTEDTSVPDQQAWYANDGGRLRDWISDKYGANYTARLFDGADGEIFPTDASDWFFDYQTGILTFSGDTSGHAKPYKLTGYRYVGTKGVSKEIGPPPDGDWTDGLLPLTDDMEPAEAFDMVNEVLAEISPDPPGTLTGQGLQLNISAYSAKLPSGLSGDWGAYTPGNTISTLIVGGSYLLASPAQTTRFKAGLWSQPATGAVTHVLDGSDDTARNIADGVGTTGNVEILDISQYNSIWRKVTARIVFTQVTEGEITHALKSNGAGTTNVTTLHYDDVNAPPAFSVAPSHTVPVEVLKYLSGIDYYTTGTIFEASYTAGVGIFTKAYHPTEVSRLSVTGASNKAVNPASVPAVAATFPVSGVPGRIELTVDNQHHLSPSISVRLNKPNGANTTLTTSLAKGITTYGTVSTTIADSFQDEAQRLVLGTSTPWTPANPLVNGNAQVAPAKLIHGADGDYPGFTGDQEYQRRVVKATASGGILTLNGISYTDIDPYNTGSLNVLLWLEDDDIYFDLGRVVGDNNGNGSGDSRANSLGSRVSGSGAATTFSFLTYSTGDNNNRYRVLIIFKATGHTITSLAGT